MFQTNAPAKVNLYLHVTGRREDGYHLLDSLAAFTGVGDRLTLEQADSLSFTLEGPMAVHLAQEDPQSNLVVRAAKKLGEVLGQAPNFKFTLTKNLPVASGIGGGSSDAAAALRLMAAFWKMAPDAPILHKIAASLGQDVPCCLVAESCFFQGIGDEMTRAPKLPYVDLVLVNPLIAVPTVSVYKAREGAFSPPAETWREAPQTASELAACLATTRNDLTQAAIRLCPPINEVLTALTAQEGVLLTRMSGSGATCFSLFENRGMAKKAAATIYKNHPSWWVVSTNLPVPAPLVMRAE